MEINYSSGYRHINISYGNDGRISTITSTFTDVTTPIVETYNITYDTNKIIFSNGGYERNYIFNNELHSYSAETINNQVFHCLSIYGIN